MKQIVIIGGGLAGCEAAYYLAERDIQVKLYEMRHQEVKSFAHKTDVLAELVCSNSFRNDDISSAIGLLHEEMRLLGSLIMNAGDDNKLPAGGALAVDRENFALDVQKKIESHPNIEVIREEYKKFNTEDEIIIATGPLTSDELSKEIISYTGEENLAFFDAIAPIIQKDSINFEVAWWQSRYDKSGPAGSGKDYINCPLSEEIYNQFVDKLLESEKQEFKDWEKNTPYFDGCLPIEVIASRGRESLRFGPMKPVGLTDPKTGKRPYAVIQLRQDNKLGNLYNIVGFQTKMKYDHQKEIFRMIPGLEHAEFARMGGIHRNSFINSPKILNRDLSLKKFPNIRFAGQITGVEGYIESAACGLMAAIFAIQKLKNQEKKLFPQETALGALLSHITINGEVETFQPMNINYGLFPSLNEKISDKLGRKKAYSDRAINSLREWIKLNNNYKGKTHEFC